jgi:hypothetical protein
MIFISVPMQDGVGQFVKLNINDRTIMNLRTSQVGAVKVQRSDCSIISTSRPPLFKHMNSEITLTELEDAINYWRMQRPSVGDECALSPEVNALATIYALMIFNRFKSLPVEQIDTVSLQLLQASRNGGNQAAK